MTNSFSQTVDDIFPTRVTTKSIVSIIGYDFDEAARASISVSGVNITDRTLVSTTEMTFEISDTSTSDKLNRAISIAATISFGVDTTLDYIAPSQRTLANTSSFFVEEIYTNWDQNNDGIKFWRSNDWVSSPTNNSTWPNAKHELLGFKMYNGDVFSTGIISKTDLEAFLPLITPSNIRDTRFKAYSTNGVQGKTNSAHYILAGDLIDELVGSAENATNNDLTSLTDIAGTTIFDVIIDGQNGLELSTGISNFNNDTSVKFFSGNGNPGIIGDDEPDLLITQIAQAGGSDIYFYADERDNVVGTPIRLSINNTNTTRLAEWRLDLYSFPGNQPFVSTNPNKRGFTNNDNEHRPIRMIAFKLEDFDINDDFLSRGDPDDLPYYIEEVNNINMVAGGTADTAFLAYNAATFEIKSPVADPLLSKFVCRTDGNSNITFTVTAGVDDGSGGITTPAPGDELSYEWSKFNIPAPPMNEDPSYIVNNVTASELATYKVKISNSNGTIVLPVVLGEGGTPTFWNGSAWTSPFGSVPDKDRNLVFSSSYSEATALVEGCDCIVASGSNVVIPSDAILVLYDFIRVHPEILATPDNSYVPAGTFTLMDDASLVQTKPVTTNINDGPILMHRDASDLHDLDYVYWSSPVEDFDLSNIPGNRTFEWLTNASNPIPDSEGNWSTATGIMAPGKGYIKRVPSATTITTDFLGRPNNGVVTTSIVTTTAPSSNPSFNNWNLIGNPYPSAINAVDFLMTNPNVDGFVDIWTHHEALSSTQNPGDSPFYENYAYNYSDQYLTHNAMGTTPPPSSGVTFNGNIAAGQAFFVQANTSGEVTFTNALRHSAEIGYDNTDFFRSNNATTKNNSEKQSIWLSLVKDDDQATTMLLGYAEGATNQKDRMFDAGTNGSDFSIYSLIEEGKMRIQGRSLPFVENDIVPLGVKLDQNGVYEIAIDRLEGSVFDDEEQAIYLEDTYTNLTHDLRQSPYTFTGNEGELNNRFLLRYTNETLSTEENSVTKTFVFVNINLLNVKSSKQINTVDVFDLNGKRIIRHYAMGQTALKTDFIYASGVYLVSVLFNDGTMLNKKVIN